MLTKDEIQEYREEFNKAENHFSQYFCDGFVSLLGHAEEVQIQMEQVASAFTALQEINEARNRILAELMAEIGKYNTGEKDDTEELLSIFYKLAEVGGKE